MYHDTIVIVIHKQSRYYRDCSCITVTITIVTVLLQLVNADRLMPTGYKTATILLLCRLLGNSRYSKDVTVDIYIDSTYI